MLRRRTALLFVTGAALAALTACSGGSQAASSADSQSTGTSGSTHDTTPSKLPSPSVTSYVKRLDTALGAVAKKVGSDPMKVTQVTIATAGVTVDAIDPKKPDELNEFRYFSGQVNGPKPVDISGSDPGALKQNLYGSDKITPSGMQTAVKAALKASKVDGAKVDTIVIKRNIPFSKSVITFINVTGTRGHKQVRTDLSGKVLKVV